MLFFGINENDGIRPSSVWTQKDRADGAVYVLYASAWRRSSALGPRRVRSQISPAVILQPAPHNATPFRVTVTRAARLRDVPLVTRSRDGSTRPRRAP